MTFDHDRLDYLRETTGIPYERIDTGVAIVCPRCEDLLNTNLVAPEDMQRTVEAGDMTLCHGCNGVFTYTSPRVVHLLSVDEYIVKMKADLELAYQFMMFSLATGFEPQFSDGDGNDERFTQAADGHEKRIEHLLNSFQDLLNPGDAGPS